MAAKSRHPLIAGNWKMNLNHFEALALVQKLAFALTDEDLASSEVVVLVPFTDLRSVQTLIEGDKYDIGYGAQDVSAHASGAFTGEISSSMLAKLGCAYVAVGHSERRQYHAETDALVFAKARAAVSAGITPIVCVGEGLDIRQAGNHVPHVLDQLDGSLGEFTADEVSELVIAYEPVWAIGTGEVATPDDAQEVCRAIRIRVGEKFGVAAAESVRILYGGSVKSSNIAGIMARVDVDGVLVGGASLDPDDFVGIVRYRLHPAELTD